MCILDCLILVSVTIFYTNKAKIWMGVVTSLHTGLYKIKNSAYFSGLYCRIGAFSQSKWKDQFPSFIFMPSPFPALPARVRSETDTMAFCVWDGQSPIWLSVNWAIRIYQPCPFSNSTPYIFLLSVFFPIAFACHYHSRNSTCQRF